MDARPPLWFSLSLTASATLLIGAVDEPLALLNPAQKPFVGRDLAIAEPPPAFEPSARTVIRRGADGMFHLDAKLNGVPMRFLIDTGTTTVVISPQDARRAGLPSGRASHLLTAGGTAPVRWTRADRMAVANRELRDVEIAVLETPFGHSLLGLEALSQLGTITIDGDRMILD